MYEAILKITDEKKAKKFEDPVSKLMGLWRMRNENHKFLESVDLDGIIDSNCDIRVPLKVNNIEDARKIKTQMYCESFHVGYSVEIYKDGKPVE